MQRFTPMTRDELLELAPLDALDLLDEYDAALFTRSFHLAPPAVRTEIQELQASVASDASLLPEVPLPDALRSRVIDAVSAEAHEAVDLAPLATIGRARRDRAAESIDRPGRVTPHRPRRQTRPPLSSHGWRAASFALCAALIVSLFYGGHSRQQSNTLLQELFVLQRGQDIGRVAGADWETFLGAPGTDKVRLEPVAPEGPAWGWGVVAFDAESGDGMVVAFGLELASDEEYRVEMCDESGSLLETLSMRASTGLCGVTFNGLRSTLASATSFRIVNSTGTIVLQA